MSTTRRVPRQSTRYVRHVSYTIVRESEPANREKLDTPERVAALARHVIPDDGREQFYAFLLDSQNALRARKTINGRLIVGGRDGGCSSSHRETDGA